MKSMTVVKSGFSRGLAAMLLVAAVSAVPTKAALVAGGSVPVINTYVGVVNTGLDVAGVGTLANLATIYVNSNTAGGWTMVITAKHSGFVRMGIAAGGTGVGDRNIFTTYQIIAGTNIGTSALGTGGVAVAATAFTTLLPAATATAAPGAQTTATVDYPIDVQATWAANTSLLAGFYQEELTVSLVAAL